MCKIKTLLCGDMSSMGQEAGSFRSSPTVSQVINPEMPESKEAGRCRSSPTVSQVVNAEMPESENSSITSSTVSLTQEQRNGNPHACVSDDDEGCCAPENASVHTSMARESRCVASRCSNVSGDVPVGTTMGSGRFPTPLISLDDVLCMKLLICSNTH